LNKAFLAAVAALVALAALVAGCGSGDETTDATVTLTKAEFIKQGDAICKKGNAEIEAGFEDFSEANDIPQNQEPSKAQGVEIVETVIVPSIKQQGEEIRALGAPEGEEKQVEDLLDSLDAAVSEAEEDPEALFGENSDPFADANQQATDYGFKVCGEE
jgi:hypothetical protein